MYFNFLFIIYFYKQIKGLFWHILGLQVCILIVETWSKRSYLMVFTYNHLPLERVTLISGKTLKNISAKQINHYLLLDWNSQVIPQQNIFFLFFFMNTRRLANMFIAVLLQMQVFEHYPDNHQHRNKYINSGMDYCVAAKINSLQLNTTRT